MSAGGHGVAGTRTVLTVSPGDSDACGRSLR